MTTRPAETAGAAGTVGSLVAFIAGVKDPQTIVFIAAGVGLVPAVVTTVVATGGIKGMAQLVWRGSAKPKGK